MAENKDKAIKKKEPETSQQLETVKAQISNTLVEVDKDRAVMAKAEGAEAPESLSDVWEEAMRQTDTNEMLRTNLMQLQVVFQEMYVELFGDITGNKKETTALIEKLTKGENNNEDWQRYKELKRMVASERVDMIKRIESMAKTIKQIQQEYRAGEMAKAQFYHISEVRAQQMFIIAIMKQFITDQTLLNTMSNALITGWQQMGSFAKNEEYNG